jgi:nucleotide-binding universal stress UspA family protein
MKILVLVDGKDASDPALRTAALLARRLGAELSVLTVRGGTHATEPAVPIGAALPLDAANRLPPGIQVLLRAADGLAALGLLSPLEELRLRHMPHGHTFAAPRVDGGRAVFSERFGGLVEEVNREVEGGGPWLVVLADRRRGPLWRFSARNLSRRLGLDLHCSLLVVRGGGLDDRLVVCADGSPAARRVFPLLRDLLPALGGAVELLCVQPTPSPPGWEENAAHCLQQAGAWLERCGKTVRLLRPAGNRRRDLILEAAGSEALIVMGESQRHDLRRRTLGSLPLQVMARCEASFLLVKQATEPDAEMFAGEGACGRESGERGA